MIRRSFRCSLVATLSIAALACATARHNVPSIEGSWSIASASLGGHELPAAAFTGPLQLSAGKYTFQNDTGEYSVNRETVPASIDVRGLQGPNAGKTIPAIFSLQGDTLTICYDLSGKARPTEFKSEAGTRLFLARYTRASR